MAGPRINSDALAAFHVFADHLNLTRAAEALHISQPALHAKLATLARELGRPLYERRGRRLVLTPDGEAVARFARDSDERLGRFLDELRETPAARPIVLAAGHGAYLHVLGDAIRRTLAARPGGLRLLRTNRDEMLDALRNGRAHLGVSVLDVLPADLVTVPVATYPQVVLAPVGHRLAGRHRIRMRDLAGADLVVPPPHRPHRIALERSLRQAGVPWSVAVEIEGWPLAVHLAELGVGLTVITGCVRPTEGLVAVPITDLPRITYYAAHRAGALDDPRTKALLSEIRATTRARGRRSAAPPDTRG
ncbi:LysR family transcriptional regulator [Catenuloplanes japonicus]|uniref:LysR family transcriptional regulator n=1 Tax=Catenuloplanes japonicus TaxID=33876 RepID=UPI00068D3472|nr:LysR family transcriptional regulator [Catenuloplanes japonicus]